MWLPPTPSWTVDQWMNVMNSNPLGNWDLRRVYPLIKPLISGSVDEFHKPSVSHRLVTKPSTVQSLPPRPVDRRASAAAKDGGVHGSAPAPANLFPLELQQFWYLYQ